MADRTEIAWCDSTFQGWTGCTKVSPGCDNCYAEAWSKRAGAKVGKWGPGAPRVRTTPANWRKPVKWNADGFLRCTACNWRGERKDTVNFGDCPLCEGRVENARRRVFCASLADVFDNEVDREWRRDLFRLIAHTKNLDWLLLTKRIGNAAQMLLETAASFGFDWAAQPWEHVWLGATIVNQEEADRDIPKLLATPARVRFLSMEPLLGPVDLGLCDCDHGSVPSPYNVGGVTCPKCNGTGGRMVDWVIVGGESGHHARPMHPDWAANLRNQCFAAGVPFLFKQWGEWIPESAGNGYTGSLRAKDDGRFESTFVKQDGSTHWISPDDHDVYDVDDASMVKVGKKAAGRLLDGRTHDGFPGVANG